MYSNEITVIFNIINEKTKKIIGDVLTPRVLRIPKEEITGDYTDSKNIDLFLETYNPLVDFIKASTTNYYDWKYGTIKYYVIQLDFFEEVLIKDVLKESVELIESYAERVLLEQLEKCIERFNFVNVFENKPRREQIELLTKEIVSRGIHIDTLSFMTTQDVEEQEISDAIKKILQSLPL